MAERKKQLLEHVKLMDMASPRGNLFLRADAAGITHPNTALGNRGWNLRQDPFKDSKYALMTHQPGVTTWAGYLENTRDPWALNYAPLFWKSEVGDQLPFDDETYNAFNQVMNQKFLNGEIPGVIRYDQPSKDEIKTILQNAGVGLIDFAHTKAAHKASKIPKTDKRGPPGLLDQ
jgi:hypothetical protein